MYLGFLSKHVLLWGDLPSSESHGRAAKRVLLTFEAKAWPAGSHPHRQEEPVGRVCWRPLSHECPAEKVLSSAAGSFLSVPHRAVFVCSVSM